MAQLTRIGQAEIIPHKNMAVGRATYYRGDGTHYVQGDLFPRDERTALTSYLSAQFNDDRGLRINISISLTPLLPLSTGGRIVYYDSKDGPLKLLGKTTFVRYALDKSGVTDATFHPTAPLIYPGWLPVDLDTTVPKFLLGPGSSVPFIENSSPLLAAPLHTRVLVQALSIFRPFEGGEATQDVLRAAGISWVHDTIEDIQLGYTGEE
jgi:hypothetical protein